MSALRCCFPVIVLFLITVTTLPEDLFSNEATTDNTNIIIVNSNPLADNDINPFIFDASDESIFTTNSMSEPILSSQSLCQIGNSPLLQRRDRLCETAKEGNAPLNLPLDLFNQPEAILRGLNPSGENGHEDDTFAQRRPVNVRCVFPFKYDVCCDGEAGPLSGALLSFIFNCRVGVLVCLSLFQGCCQDFVSSPTKLGRRSCSRIKIDITPRIRQHKWVALVISCDIISVRFVIHISSTCINISQI